MIDLSFFIILVTLFGSKAANDCQCNKLYSNLCLSPPKILLENVTFQSMIDKQPHGGYRGGLGDEMARLHMAQLLLGRKLRLSDNFANLCFKKLFEKQYLQNNGGESTLLGFGILQSAQEKCIPSKRVKGMLTCRVKTREPSKYAEIFDLYIATVDSKRNLFIVVMCFQNENVAWHSLSSKSPIPNQDRRAIENHVRKLGFPLNSTVELYGSKCEQDIK